MTIEAVDWGDVPTWVSAITTLGALFAAGVVVYIEMRRDRRSTDQSERAEQADKCAAWHGERPSIGSGQAFIVVRNGSELPIYRVVVSVFHASGKSHLAVPMIPPGDHHMSYPDSVVEEPSSTDLRLWFTDTAGRGWQRRSDGRLRRLAEDEKPLYYTAAISGDATAELGDEPPL